LHGKTVLPTAQAAATCFAVQSHEQAKLSGKAVSPGQTITW
jgi:hypothetical protein